MNVQKFVKPVLKNVKSILTWSIAKDVQRYADPALIYAIHELQRNVPRQLSLFLSNTLHALPVER